MSEREEETLKLLAETRAALEASFALLDKATANLELLTTALKAMGKTAQSPNLPPALTSGLLFTLQKECPVTTMKTAVALLRRGYDQSQ